MNEQNQYVRPKSSKFDWKLLGWVFGCCVLSFTVIFAVIWGSFAGGVSSDRTNEASRPRSATTAPKPETKRKLYQATIDMTVARTQDALQQSPLTHPANFIRVPKGTIVTLTWIGGGLSGRIYYELTAITDNRPVELYVYRDAMEGWNNVDY